MKILSVHDGHNATACYLKDGKIISMVSEERFTNKKNQGGFPENSVSWILKHNSLSMDDFDFIIFPHLIYTHDYNSGYGLSNRHILFYIFNLIFPASIAGSNKLIQPYIKYFGIFRKRLLKSYAKKFNFNFERVCQVEHHLAHGYAALYGSGFTKEEDSVLIFTLDDSGDGISSRIAVWSKTKGYQKIHENQSFHSLGNLYSFVTKFLGMKPGEDEYKVMGMAPYVPNEKLEKSFKKFLKYIDTDNYGKIINKKFYGPIWLNVLKKDFFLERFDNICAGVQKHFEYVVLNWVKFWTGKTGARKAVFGGGGFMNVKINMLISELEEFHDVYFCPSCGDESTALGAAYRVAEEKGEESIYPIKSLYVGPWFEENDIEKELERYGNKLSWEKFPDIEKKVAQLLKEGNIVARFKGSAEWGARALGGRSILCRADNLSIINRLNRTVKMRDFWMPFAPSILDDDADKYILNFKETSAWFMMLAFHSTEKARREIIAALHPFDYTCRPQIVTEEINPSYYKLLKYFKELTGFAGILNTSFNLHGYPIVGTPKVAIETLVNSEIDYLAIENFLVKKIS